MISTAYVGCRTNLAAPPSACMSVASWALACAALVVTPVAWLRRALRPKPAVARNPDLAADGEGLWLRRRVEEGLRWDEVTRVRLEWSENPWGDPQFGAYCDVEWVVESATARSLRFDDWANRAVLFESAAKRLPGFDCDYDRFEREYWSRLSDLAGGSLVVWSRAR